MWCKNLIFVCAWVLTLNYSAVDAQRGTSCRTPNQEVATCESIYSCDQLLQTIKTRDSIQLRFLRESQCGYDREPLVCCGSRASYRTSSSQGGGHGRTIGFNSGTPSGNRNSNFRLNPLIPGRSSCGHDFSDKIFGGTATQVNEYPWMALLEYLTSNGERRFACAGTLINNRYILTAAHCVTGDILRKVGRLINVRLGEYDTNQAIDCDGGLCNNPVNIGVDQTIAHEGYDNDNMHRYDDIALVRLARPVSFSNFIQPICLPLLNEAGNVGDRVVVAGWGKTEQSNRSNIKLKVEIPLAQRSQCTRAFATAGINLRSSQICAGGQRGRDSCTGDSGGPLMKTVANDPSTWYQEGIVSFGARCGTEGWPGIYTKVENYVEWIHRNVRN